LFNAKKRRIRAEMWVDELVKFVYSQRIPLDAWKVGVSDDPKVRGARFDDSKWPLAVPDKPLGKIDTFVWLRKVVTIPKEFAGGEVELHLSVGRQGELFGHTGLFFVDGREVAGHDRVHKRAPLTHRAKAGQRFQIAAQFYTGPVDSFAILEFGEVHRFKGGAVLSLAELRLVDPDAFRIYHDFATAKEILTSTKEGSRQEAGVLAAVSDAINVIDLQADPARRSASFRAASAILHKRLYNGQKSTVDGKIFPIAQSHIDMAWLWPARETVLKCAGTMANTMSLEDRYPKHFFSHSQAVGFQWLKDKYPNLFKRCQAAAKAKRLDIVGGTWVEADLNCTSGESLARQFLYGQRFFIHNFGLRSRVGWLIDTFGYTWTLPQILKESGLDYFVSTKPTWNDTNTFPFTTFWWESPDGTRVLTHIPPLSYGGGLSANRLVEALEKNKEARLGVAPMILYGRSDGGGGPTVMDLENISRLTASPYVPQMEATTAVDWFNRVDHGINYPVLPDEMYVETHRGTYTSQARTKRNNRKSECALFAAELVATAAHLLGGKYPAVQIEAAWKLALFNQFHDILPGSSIGPVYKDADETYARVFETTRKVTDDALAFVAKKIDTTGPGQAVLVFNPAAWERTDVVEIDAPGRGVKVTDSEGVALPSQGAYGAKKLAVLVTVPACGWQVIRVVAGKGAALEPVARVNGRTIDTELFRVRLNAAGQVSELFDKEARRQALTPGETGNRFQMFEDIPVEYEAWDIDEWYAEKMKEVKDLVSFDVIENGPVRTVVLLKWKAGKSSTITQRMILYGHTRRIDFVTEVDWRERKTLLKVAFPAAVRARRATYEIAYGAIDRGTTEGNTFDWARFEVPAHKWADISQADYGVSLLNDSKYGHDTHGSVLRLSLLRSPEAPDPEADQGRQDFTYSVLPHRGDWREAGTVMEAFDLNVPLLAAAVASKRADLPPQGWLFSIQSVTGAPVVLTALKKAEDSDAVIARVYEAHGADADIVLRTPFDIAKATKVNILEEPQSPLRHGTNDVRLSLSPWKIATIKLNVR